MSLYSDLNVEAWDDVTEKLIRKFPLPMDEIVEVVCCSWKRLWQTQIGDEKLSFPLSEIDPPATVVGYMLEKLIAKELNNRYPNLWRGYKNDSDKDIVFIPDNNFSFEIKTSGQRGIKIFGNRSYGQKLQDNSKAKKDKSGYYLTVNFYKTTLNLIRFGWIDAEDWKAQAASTGQMASLSNEVYDHKLKSLIYDYCLSANIWLVKGVSPKVEEQLNNFGIHTIGDLINSPIIEDRKYRKFQTVALETYGDLVSDGLDKYFS